VNVNILLGSCIFQNDHEMHADTHTHLTIN